MGQSEGTESEAVPMSGQLSEMAVLEYQQIYKKEFGEEISLEEAAEQGTKLLRLFDIIYGPIKKKWLKK